METLLPLLYFVNVALVIAGHELDAIQQQEWRFFFPAPLFSDQSAYRLFTALHIPLVVLSLWNLHSTRFQIGFDLFTIIHAGLHWVLRNHPKIHFNHWFSRLWIFGAALLGALHLLLLQVAQ
jgi:hypothetical protein